MLGKTKLHGESLHGESLHSMTMLTINNLLRFVRFQNVSGMLVGVKPAFVTDKVSVGGSWISITKTKQERRGLVGHTKVLKVHQLRRQGSLHTKLKIHDELSFFGGTGEKKCYLGISLVDSSGLFALTQICC